MRAENMFRTIFLLLAIFAFALTAAVEPNNFGIRNRHSPKQLPSDPMDKMPKRKLSDVSHKIKIN